LQGDDGGSHHYRSIYDDDDGGGDGGSRRSGSNTNSTGVGMHIGGGSDHLSNEPKAAAAARAAAIAAGVARSQTPRTFAQKQQLQRVLGRRTPAPDKDTGRYGHALVVDGEVVGVMLCHCPELLRALAVECVSVLGCRLSPMQKALVVRLVKKAPNPKDSFMRWLQWRSPVTLSIGDGANDVAMIREAHVGVAILGNEGRQAARASDYAMGKFKFLKRLLLVHGHYSYVRISYTIQYFFYKNVVMNTPLLLYQFWNLWSSGSLYDSWLLMAWNMFFTAIPIMFYGMFERDLSPDELLEHPRVYRSLQGNAMLSYTLLGKWLLTGVVHGLIVLYGSAACFSAGVGVSVDNLAIDQLLFGTAVYTSALLAVTTRICMDTSYWSTLNVVGVLGCSLLVYFVFLLLYTGINDIFGTATTSGIYWVGFKLWTWPVWRVMLVVTVSIFITEFAISFGKRVLRPTAVQKVQAFTWRKEAAALVAARRQKEDHYLEKSSLLYEDEE